MPTVEIDLERHIDPKKLKINPGFKQLIPHLGEKEFEQLSTNVLSEGCRHPILHWNGYIVDGHHRYEICTKHSIPFRVSPLIPHPETEKEVKIWMIQNALGTRSLTKFEQIELSRELNSLVFESRQGKRTDLEIKQEIEEYERASRVRKESLRKKNRERFKELQTKKELTRSESYYKRQLEKDLSSHKNLLTKLTVKENLTSEEKEEKDFLEDFFSRLRGELQTLKNKSKQNANANRRIGVLNKYLFGIDEGEANEKRLQELQDKDTLTIREKNEKIRLDELVYGQSQTSLQICNEVDEDDLEDLTNDEEEEVFEEKPCLVKEQKPHQKTAKYLGIGSCTLSKSRYIEKHADEKLKKELRAGKKSIDGAYRKLKAKAWDYIGCFPKNSYRVFYADFWGKCTSTYAGSVIQNYEFGISNITSLKALPIKEVIEEKKGAVCFLWSPLQKIESTISIMKAWGFSYRTLFTLENTQKFKGVYNSSDSLVVIVGACIHNWRVVDSDPINPTFNKDTNDWEIDHDRLLSSVLTKTTFDWEPDNDRLLSSTLDKSISGKNRVAEFRKIIDQMYTSGNKIQLFSTNETSTWDAILS